MAWDEKSKIVLLDPEKNTKEFFFLLFQNSQIWKMKDIYIYRLIKNGNFICNKCPGPSSEPGM